MNILVSGSLAYDRIMNFPGYFSEHILPDKIHDLNVCFQVDGMALLDMAWRIDRGVRVFTIDTGRLPQETYDLLDRRAQRRL